MSTQVMVDIETLGTGSSAVILSIGAVKFDTDKPDLQDSFYVAIEPKTCTDFGLKIDADTVMWWLHPDRAPAREQMQSEMRLDLATALDGFAQWFGPDSLPVWGNGCNFDNVILRSAYEACGLECPWKFWHDRCYRTVKTFFPPLDTVRHGVYHNALDDAIYQTDYLLALAAKHNLPL